jgi:hypothetical protein
MSSDVVCGLGLELPAWVHGQTHGDEIAAFAAAGGGYITVTEKHKGEPSWQMASSKR